MIVPIFNSMMRIDRSLLEAADRRRARPPGRTLTQSSVIPWPSPASSSARSSCSPSSGDFVTVGVMGGQQIASVARLINTQMGNFAVPAGGRHAVVLLASVLVLIWGLTRLVDIPQGALGACHRTQLSVVTPGACLPWEGEKSRGPIFPQAPDLVDGWMAGQARHDKLGTLAVPKAPPAGILLARQVRAVASDPCTNVRSTST